METSDPPWGLTKKSEKIFMIFLIPVVDELVSAGLTTLTFDGK
jgi:hypothetical protein